MSDMIMSMIEIVKAISILVVFSTLLALTGVFVALIPIFFRMYRIRRLADIFGLTYTSNFKWFRLSSDSKYERNVLYGKVNGQTVRIYDLYDDKYWPPPSFYGDDLPANECAYFGRIMTVLEFNWANPSAPKFFVKEGMFGVRGVAAVRTIRQILEEIGEHGADAKITSYALKQAPKITRVMYIVALLVTFMLIVVFLSLSK